MITKVVHGWRIAGLVDYLMGPGRAQEHVNPRVIATWDGQGAAWQPGLQPSPAGDVDVAALVRALRAPVVAAGLPEQDLEGKRGYVWHCSVRAAEADRALSDEEWAEIARELLHGAGVAARDDHGGPRWVAVRHADDHIHIAVVLVRQDTCRRVWPSWDYPRLRATARTIEQRLELTPTAASDGTAASAPVRGEVQKAERHGREPARVALSRLVRSAAVEVSGPAAFVAALEAAGVVVALRRAPSGDLLGYKVALAGDVDRAGKPVFFSGSTLAPDLSLPRLMRAWSQTAPGTAAGDAVVGAARRVEQARAAVVAARRGQLGEDPDDLAHAALDVLVAIQGWGPELEQAADRFARSARAPRGASPQPSSTGAGLRRVARQLVRARRLDPAADPAAAGVALAIAMAALLVEIAAWQREWQRPHQAAAAQESAEAVQRWSARQSTAAVGGGDLVASRGQGVATPRPRREPPRRPASG